jgi:hypothetical protein
MVTAIFPSAGFQPLLVFTPRTNATMVCFGGKDRNSPGDGRTSRGA